MGMPSHPRLRARATPRFAMSSDAGVRALVLAPRHEQWIERELVGTAMHARFARSVGEVVAALVDSAPPRPQMLIIDLESLSVGELLELHTVREQGWFGSVIAIGRVALSLRTSLQVERAILIGRGKLRPFAVVAGQHTNATMRMPKISG